MRRPRRSLSIVTGPTGEPVSLDDAKAWLRIDDDDSDTVITQLITAARMACEEYLRRSLLTQTYKLTLDLFGSPLGNWLGGGVFDLPVTALYGGLPQVIELPKGPIRLITSVTTYDLTDTATTYAAGNYHVDADGGRLVLNYGAIWPSNLRPVAACEITYTAGYGAASDVPQPIKTGILIHVASIYEQRGQCDDAMALPPGSAQLYNQYRILGDRRGEVLRGTTVASLKRRLTIQSSSTLSDGQGGFTESWVDGATVWASVEPVKGYERFQAMQMQTPVTHDIVMRYRTDVTTGSRLKYGTRFFWVQEALNADEDGRFLNIKAVERVVLASDIDIGALLLESGAYLTLNGGGRLLLGA